MAEFSGFWTTGGTKGDQQVSYTQAQWSTASAIMSACSGFEGVAPGYLNGLAGTVTGANTVAINTGGGMVDGKFFKNDASQNVTIPSAAASNTRIDRIVLRADWANFNVSVTRIAGTDTTGTPTAPAITQTSGTTYDIKLYQALVDAAGTVTLTDERAWAGHPVVHRQGGSATAWSTVGTTDYLAANGFIQCGAQTSSASGDVTITFPEAYDYQPVVFIFVDDVNALTYTNFVGGTTNFTISVYNGSNARVAKGFYWMAIGPKS